VTEVNNNEAGMLQHVLNSE